MWLGKSLFIRPQESCLNISFSFLKLRAHIFVVLSFINDDIFRSEYFKAMVTKIGEYGPLYMPPSSEALRTTLLDKEKRLVEQAVANTKRLWEKNGVSLIADGWSDTRKRSIHGLVAYSHGEMSFIS